MTVTLKEFAGGAAATTLSAGIANNVLALAVADGSTFPTGATAPFVIVVGRGTASEEKILVTSRSGNNLTLSTRAYDGSTAAAHSTGDAVEHVLDATTVAEANKAAVNTIGKITTAGDLLVGTGTEAMKRLAMGAAYKAVGVNAGATDLAYVDTPASLLTTQGDIVYASAANTPARLPLGTAGQALVVNAGATAPAWGAALASILTTQGDIPYASSANTPARLAKGTANQALIMNAGATAPSWGDSLASLLSAKGSLPTASAANTPAALAAGADFTRLRARAGATNGVEWASLASGATVATQETTTSTTYTDLATTGPAVTLTTGTSVLILLSSYLDNSVGNVTLFTFAVSGASTVAAADVQVLRWLTTNAGAQFGAAYLVTGLTAGSNTFTAKYRVTGGTGTFQNRNLTVIPI